MSSLDFLSSSIINNDYHLSLECIKTSIAVLVIVFANSINLLAITIIIAVIKIASKSILTTS